MTMNSWQSIGEVAARVVGLTVNPRPFIDKARAALLAQPYSSDEQQARSIGVEIATVRAARQELHEAKRDGSPSVQAYARRIAFESLYPDKYKPKRRVKPERIGKSSPGPRAGRDAKVIAYIQANPKAKTHVVAMDLNVGHARVERVREQLRQEATHKALGAAKT